MEASNFIGVTMEHGAVILFAVRILHCRIACELQEDGLTLPLLFTISSHTSGTGQPARLLSVPVVLLSTDCKRHVMFLQSHTFSPGIEHYS